MTCRRPAAGPPRRQPETIPMKIKIPDGWSALVVSPCELRLASTLENGQCFGWQRQPGNENVWVGVLVNIGKWHCIRDEWWWC